MRYWISLHSIPVHVTSAVKHTVQYNYKYQEKGKGEYLTTSFFLFESSS
jgi:hypothetical protein